MSLLPKPRHSCLFEGLVRNPAIFPREFLATTCPYLEVVENSKPRIKTKTILGVAHIEVPL